MSTRRPTRRDVALKAGVAPSTVSLVLQNKGDELRIPACTQDRVREAARSLGYYPNWHIGSVLKGRSGVLGLYLRWDQWCRPDGYWPTLHWNVQCAVAEADVRLLVHNARRECPTEEAFARQAGGIVDGVIILNSGKDPIVNRIVEVGLPAVEIGDPYSQLPFVGNDGGEGIRLAMEHLSERGYKWPAYIGHYTSYEEAANVRKQAFAYDARNLFGLDGAQRTLLTLHVSEVFDALLSINPRPDCVICESDEYAYQLLQLCATRGISVPEELAIVGSDALPAFGSLRVMTSIASPMKEMATWGIQKLLAIIEGRPIEHGTMLPSTLRIGDTT